MIIRHLIYCLAFYWWVLLIVMSASGIVRLYSGENMPVALSWFGATWWIWLVLFAVGGFIRWALIGHGPQG